MRELHSNGAIRLHHNMYEKECIEEYKEEYRGINRQEYTGTIEQYQCLTFVLGVGDNVQDNRKCL